MDTFKKKIYYTQKCLTGVATLGLPLVHTIETFLLLEIVSSASSLFCNIIISLIIVGPSVFMIFMGFNLSDQKSPKSFFIRGLIFLLLGMFLSVLRSIIPITLVCLVIDTTFDHIFSFIVLSDIYIFVGLFLMLFSLFLKLKLSATLMLFVSIVMLLINYFLSGIFKTNSETINALIGNFIYVDDGSIFSIFSWSVFPTFGYFAKKMLEDKDDKKAIKILKISSVVSLAVFTITAVLLTVFGYDVMKILVSPLNDYITDIFNVVLLISINIVLIGIVFLIIDKIYKLKVFIAVSWLSKNVVSFFMIQWLVITVTCYVIAVFYTLNETFISIPIMLAVAVFNTVISILITKKLGYKIMKFMLKTVTLNGSLKST